MEFEEYVWRKVNGLSVEDEDDTVHRNHLSHHGLESELPHEPTCSLGGGRVLLNVPTPFAFFEGETIVRPFGRRVMTGRVPSSGGWWLK